MGMKPWQKRKQDERKEVNPSEKLRAAHAQLLDVIATESVDGLMKGLSEAQSQIRSGQLKEAHTTLLKLGRANTRIQADIRHAAKQLGVDLVEEYDDEDDDEE